jgi:hypothetical protein
MESIEKDNSTTSDTSLENSIHIEDSFVVVHDTMFVDENSEKTNNRIEQLERRNKKLEDDYDKLERRHSDLLKLMNELLKIKPSNHLDGLENLDEIRQRITQILYNEVRRHTVFSFTPILGSYTFPIMKSTSIQNIVSNNNNNSNSSNDDNDNASNMFLNVD